MGLFSASSRDKQTAANAAHALAERMPSLLIEAKRVAQTVEFGIHGRRRAGPGETFWQFRHYEQNDAAAMIDWRRSASSDHLYVREREWEAAHTVWLWLDMSNSMTFRSKLASVSKLERALVLALATAELLVRGGERVGAPGILPPSAQRNTMEKLARAYLNAAQSGEPAQSAPPRAALKRFSGAIFFSDFLEPVNAVKEGMSGYTGRGVRGRLVQILDPAEETLPYEGRVEFMSPEGGLRILTDRVESLRGEYRQRLLEHRQALSNLTRRSGWTYHLHHTDHSAAEALLALYMAMAGLRGGDAPRVEERA
jgi:uncharacterized protein (DUF58 family)